LLLILFFHFLNYPRWWVYTEAPGGNRGWVASWFLTCPTNRLPGIDDCTADALG